MSGNYPDNLPDSTPSAAPAPSDAAPAPQSTYDTLKNRGSDIMARVDSMTRGTSNPDNNLPATSFHPATRDQFVTTSTGKRARNTPM